VAVGARVFADAQTVRLNARAEGNEALAIVPGANVLLTSPAAPERVLAGKVVEARRQSQDRAVVEVMIEASNSDLTLRPGMAAFGADRDRGERGGVVALRKWWAATDSDDHYIYAIALSA
jgi:hypothetical protein